MSSRREPENLQHQAEHARPRRYVSVFGYLAILFGAAFLLLLMAYFQQQRSNAEAVDALQQSQSTVESIQHLLEENQALTQQTAQLEERTEALERELLEAEAFSAEARNDLREKSLSLDAMDYFWQIDEAYALKRYDLCLELIRAFEDSGLAGCLPDEKAFENNRFSPAARYQEICEALY